LAATGVLPEYQPREPSCSWRWCLGYEEDTVVSRCGGSGGIQRGRGTPSGFVLVRQRFWVIFDSVEGSGEHLAESRFQFAPGEVVLDGTTARTAFPDANLLLQAVGSVAFDHAHIEKGQEKPRSGWYSDSYGKIEPAPRPVVVRASQPALAGSHAPVLISRHSRAAGNIHLPTWSRRGRAPPHRPSNRQVLIAVNQSSLASEDAKKTAANRLNISEQTCYFHAPCSCWSAL